MSGVFGFTGWRSVAVQHCHGAQGLVLEHSQGWKLVYSGVWAQRFCQSCDASSDKATKIGCCGKLLVKQDVSSGRASVPGSIFV
jgi:hypothetical protein